MNKNLYLIALLSIAIALPAAAQQKATGLSNVKLFLDPGHSRTENQGLYKYSEAEKTLRVAHAIREYLLAYTDMRATNIKLCREDDNTEVSLTQRTDAANAWGADFYYSIHSDAVSNPPSPTNSTLFMYGGWRVNGVIHKAQPEGGEAFGDFLKDDLTGVMRIGTRGNMADRTFYDGANTHANQWAYLHVNRESHMASILSEAGHHTSPIQQSRNLNAEWKRLEGYAAYQSLVKFLSYKYGAGAVQPVQVGIVTGFITDGESNTPLNGATITVTDGSNVKTYTTDTYDSLFKNHSNNPNELHNGFYFIEGLTPGATVQVRIEADGFQTENRSLVIPAAIGGTTKDGLGILDVTMTSYVPSAAAVVSGVEPADRTALSINEPLILTFSRAMNRASVESAISLIPDAGLSYAWNSDNILRINLSQLAFNTSYTLTIDGSIALNSETGTLLDGDNDGNPGGNYLLPFSTGEQQITSIVSYDPMNGSDQAISARPIVRIEFSAPLNPSSIAPNQITVTNQKGETVSGTQRYFTINGKSVLHFFFAADLEPERNYTVTLAPGLQDAFGAPLTDGLTYSFLSRPRETTLTTVLDHFETMGTWWQPGGSGSTTGTDTQATKIEIDRAELTSNQSTGSLRLDYRWAEDAAIRLIRVHNTAIAPKFSKDNVIQYYLFGDGSRNKFRVALRNGGAGSFFAHPAIELDWVGWKKITWDLSGDPFDHWLIGGSDAMPEGDALNLSALALEGADEENLSYLPGSVYIDDLQVVKLGKYLPNSLSKPQAEDEISILFDSRSIRVNASQAIDDLRVYSLSGALLKSVQPRQTMYQIPTGDWPAGVYILKAAAGNAQKNIKLIIQ
jgi:N-acetylmuramoyl-L-alanine amidase